MADLVLGCGRCVAVDEEGYLRRLDDWDEQVAAALAAQQGIALQASHWEILHLLRGFHEQYEMSPASRALVNLMKRQLGPDKGRSIYLMRLFGGSFARTASRIAGLPKPDNCL